MTFKEKLSHIKWKHYLAYIAIALVMLIFGVISKGLPASICYLLEKTAIAMILAVSLSLVVGFLGELSLGHAGFMCVGAYLGGKAAMLLQPMIKSDFLVLLIALIVGGVAAGICGFIIGLPALRLKGDYLAITTLAFGEIVRTVFQNTSQDSFGGAIGLQTGVIRYDRRELFLIAFAVLLLTVAVIQNLIRSKHGRAITAIRDNEIAARATGINVTYYKLTGFVVAAIFAGLAGVLFAHTQTVQSATFDYNYSIEILVMVVLGGMGSINGSLIAAVAITFLNERLGVMLTGDLAVLKDLVYALILILIVIYNNAPALSSFREKHNLQALIRRIRRGRHSKADTDDTGRWDVVPTKIKMDALLSTDFVVTEIKADKPKEDGK